MKTPQQRKAASIRSVIRYLQKFKNAVIVIYLDDETIESPLFTSHVRDIALLHQAGLKVIIIPGTRSRIDQILKANSIEWTYKNQVRVTPEAAMPLIKMAAFDVSNTVMTTLAANNITAVIGNWVRGRSKGIIDGFDYGTAGEIERLNVEAIQTVLNDGFIPIFPCIGWNAAGRPYNISSVSLSQQVAIHLGADKLFYVMQTGSINGAKYKIPEGFAIAENGDVAAMNLDEVENFISINSGLNDSASLEIMSVLEKACEACTKGVTRVHIVDGTLDGVLPCEIFSDLGSGTMIYTNNYGKIRQMVHTDIAPVLTVMRPFIDSGKLLPRTESQLAELVDEFIVYELDGGVHACAGLHQYAGGQCEIEAVAVDENFAHMGIGPKLIKNLFERAKNSGAKSVFIMTTQASDWFEKLGFIADSIDTIPAERKAKWTPERNSKVYRKIL